MALDRGPEMIGEVALDALMGGLGGLAPDQPAIDDLDLHADVFRQGLVDVQRYLRQMDQLPEFGQIKGLRGHTASLPRAGGGTC
jgi:hypothetical protein